MTTLADRGVSTDRGQDWRDHAECHPNNGHDPELFYPIGNGGEAYARTVELAKAICAECHVRRDCLTDALHTADRDGIRGGLTPRERAQLGRRKRPIP